MSANKLVAANIALGKCGSRPITSFVEDGSNEAKAVNAVWDDVLDEVLSEGPWSFAQKRKALDYVVPDDTTRTIEQRVFTPVDISDATDDDPVVITSANHGFVDGDRVLIVGVVGMTELNGNYYSVMNATRTTFELVDQDTYESIDGSDFISYASGGQVYLADDVTPLLITAATVANPVVLTASAHGFSNGDWIKIVGVKGMTQLNNNFYIVAGVTTNTFQLTDTSGVNVDGSAYTVYTSGGQIYEAIKMPTIDNSAIVVYQKPSDFIKPNKKNVCGALIQIEEDKIISDAASLAMIYTFRCTDATKWFPKFTAAFTTRLAAEMCFRLTNSASKAEALRKLYNEVDLPSALSVDSTQGTPNEPSQDEWLDSMQSGARFVTNLQTWHPI